MKKLSKTLLSVAAVTAVSAAMAASAMAMTASYADGTLTLSDVNNTGASQTILVLSDNGTVTEDTIKQIDQKDDSTVFSTVPVGTLTDGTYYVRIGGTDGTMQTAEFTVGGGTVDPETMDLMIGDVDFNNKIQMNDASYVATKSVYQDTEDNANVGTSYKVVSGLEDVENVVVGDVNIDGKVQMNDASYIATKSVYQDTEDNANVGTTIKVEKK